MKKNLISVALLCMTFVFLAGIAVVGISAVAENNSRTAVYATAKPVIDGERDLVYTTATPLYVNNANRCILQLLWDEDGLYIFAEVKDNGTKAGTVDFYISGMDYANELGAETKWEETDGNYWFECKKDGTIAKPFSFTESRVPEGFAHAVVETEGGFNAEFFIPMSSDAWNIEDGESAFVGFGAMWCRDWWKVNGIPTESMISSPYLLNTVKLEPNPCTHKTYSPATCQAPETCTGCGMTRGEVDPSNHAEDAVWTITDETHSGVYPCCNLVISEGEHTWEEEFTVDVEPTCVRNGSKYRKCSQCTATKDLTRVDALGHDFGDWTVLHEATCTETGKRHKTCSRCWAEGEVEVIDMLPHTADEWVIDQEAQPGVAGARHQVCTVCGTDFNHEEIPALAVNASKGCRGSLHSVALPVVLILLPAVYVRKKKKIR